MVVWTGLNGGAARLAARYPRVWHVMEADGAGEWLAETGLLPAADLWPCGANRNDFHSVDGEGWTAVLRPQQMPDHRLLPTLSGAFTNRPKLWRQHVNRHVFFWTDERRRDAFIRACIRLRVPPAPRPPVTLVVNTAALQARHGTIAFFATINTGSTVRGGARVRRDENTLRPVADYRAGPIAELAIRGRVDLSGLAVLDPP